MRGHRALQRVTEQMHAKQRTMATEAALAMICVPRPGALGAGAYAVGAGCGVCTAGVFGVGAGAARAGVRVNVSGG